MDVNSLVPPRAAMSTADSIPVPVWVKEAQYTLERLTRQLKDQDYAETHELKFPFQCPERSAESNDLIEKMIAPHWKEFIEAVKSCGSNSQWWSFGYFRLPSPMLDMLRPALITSNIHTLKMSVYTTDNRRGISKEQFHFLCKVIRKNSNIKRFIAGGGIHFSTKKFAKAFSHHPSLEEMHFCNMNLSKGHVLDSIMDACKSKNLKCLNIRNIDIGTEGSAKISRFLESNYGLSRIDLVDVMITDSDAATLAEALRSNTNLRFLSLTGTANMMSSVGRKFLFEALFNANSLDSIAESNHTCFVRTVNNFCNGEPCQYEALLDILNCNSCPRENLKWKILSVLYDTKGRGICEELERYCHNKVLPELMDLISEERYEDEIEESSEGSLLSTSSVRSLVHHIRGFYSTSFSTDQSDDDDSDVISIESDSSFDGYDSELDELDDAFEEDADEVFDDFDKSFSDMAFTDKRARLTMLFQVVKLWGLPELDRNPPTDTSANHQALPVENKRKSRPKRKHRELESLKN